MENGESGLKSPRQDDFHSSPISLPVLSVSGDRGGGGGITQQCRILKPNWTAFYNRWRNESNHYIFTICLRGIVLGIFIIGAALSPYFNCYLGGCNSVLDFASQNEVESIWWSEPFPSLRELMMVGSCTSIRVRRAGYDFCQQMRRESCDADIGADWIDKSDSFLIWNRSGSDKIDARCGETLILGFSRFESQPSINYYISSNSRTMVERRNEVTLCVFSGWLHFWGRGWDTSKWPTLAGSR